MKISNLLVGVGLMAIGACTHVVVHPELVSSDLIPPLTVVNPQPKHVLPSVLAATPTPVREPTFADLSPSAWTLQIAAVKSLAEIEQIEANNRLLSNNLHVLTRHAEHGDLHAVLVGVYSTQAEAAQIASRLPTRVAGDEPWIRSVASVQAVMR
jgi:septal ring-binding cell division protein DamX